MKAAIGLTLLLATLAIARVAAQVTLPKTSPSPTPTIPSVAENLWSGSVDDLAIDHGRVLTDLHGSMQIDFASERFTMGGDSLGDGDWSRSGIIRDFQQSSPNRVTFTLYLEANCVYSASARVEDGHFKGSYSGCSYATRNGGTFDLLPVPSPTPTPTPVPTDAPSPTPRPTRAPTPTPAERHAMASSAAVIEAMRSAELRYCKTAAGLACSYYMMHAGSCLGTALGADAVYQGVRALKKAGFASTQVQAQEDYAYGADSDKAFIAAAALKILDEREHYDPGAFEMAVMRACLAQIAK